MNWINICLSAWILIMIIMVNKVQSSGLFELRLKYFNNDNGRDNDGRCCSGHLDSLTGKCTGTCKTRFRVCLKHYQAKIDTTSPCTFGDVITPILGENSVNLTNINSNYEKDGFTNPIQFSFNFAWPGTFTLIVEAWHNTDNETNTRSNNLLISRLSVQRVLEVTSDWTPEKYESTNSWLQYDYRVTCDPHYYGNGCANLCRPRDDSFGHYTCSLTGEIICLSGWQGNYCEKPKCTQGCQHGGCEKPNECKCHVGWKGPLCDECELYPGCVHGTCQKPWDCHCHEGWGGLLCNQDLNYCTNHRPCSNGGTCRNTGPDLYTCECPLGYTGNDCEIEINDCKDSPCLNSGICVNDTMKQSYKCECKSGWTGRHCEEKILTCADKPCLHGKCHNSKQGFRCECPKGFRGVNCETHIDNCNPNVCQNGGTCVTSSLSSGSSNNNNAGINNNSNEKSFKCVCPSGFTGDRCEENIDNCVGSPCLNGGTCIDMVNQFRCQCIPGYLGLVCAQKVDLCLTKPCANGGSCTNLNNDYVCACRSGFTGKDCSTDIDECSSSPCHNGGTCVNRVNSFQCVCASGYRGLKCDEEAFSASLNARQYEDTMQGRSDGLTSGQVILIAILSVAMPVVAVIAACVVICMKRKRKRAQEKDDAEARKQNEQNASANMHNGGTTLSKRSSSSGLAFDNSNPNIIKNTWDKSVNNISSSASVDDCLMNTSLYGAMSNYSDNNANSEYFVGSITPLQRAKSQKQLNTDPSLMHRASQIISSGGVPTTTKEYMLDSKRISVLGEQTFCSPRWPTPTNGLATSASSQSPSRSTMCGAPHM